MRTLLIDDMRDIPADVVARTFEGGIEALIYDGPFDILYLDHDLGEEDESPREIGELRLPSNGYGIMCYLEAWPTLLPKKIIIVSSNPVGRKNMQVVIDRLYGSGK